MDVFEINEMVVELMARVDDDELNNLSKTNKLINQIFNSDIFWKFKVEYQYPDLVDNKYEHEQWSDYYFTLKRNYDSENYLNFRSLFEKFHDENEFQHDLSFHDPQTNLQIFLEIKNVNVIEPGVYNVTIILTYQDPYGGVDVFEGDVIYNYDRNDISSDFENNAPPRFSLIEILNINMEDLEPYDFGY